MARSAASASGADDPEADPEAVARQICLRLLTAAPRTRAQLATALARRGIPEEAAAAVLERFADVQLIDDAMFARAWVDSRHHGRGLARRALAAELRQRGVAAGDIDAAVRQLDPEQERATARALIDRRLAATRRLPGPARYRRLMGLLARRGYPEGLAATVVRDALAAEPPEPPVLPGDAAPPGAAVLPERMRWTAAGLSGLDDLASVDDLSYPGDLPGSDDLPFPDE